MNVIDLCERGWVPDSLARMGMRRLMAQRLRDESADDGERRSERFEALVRELQESPIAVHTDAANTQHYEVPPSFFKAHLGANLKYSCCYYPHGDESLNQAEEAMLELYVSRAQIEDGMRILDLGCGWGSASLWLARRFPNATVVGLSNSHGQRRFIEMRARAEGVKNLSIYTGDVVSFNFPADVESAGFDRVVSIEMFEHMKNYRSLLAKVARWLAPDGRLFVHVFAHRLLAYHFEDKADDDWMSRYFFTGGTMPSEHLFARFQDDLNLERQWWVSGRHYERTSNQWLAQLDAARSEILPVFESCYGPDQAKIWLQRWRMFYMAVAELFGYQNGEQWGVCHYLFSKREKVASAALPKDEWAIRSGS